MNINIEKISNLDNLKLTSNTFDLLKYHLRDSIEKKIRYKMPIAPIIEDEKVKASYIPDPQLSFDRQDKLISLTFDDSPSQYTKRLLDVLNKNNCKATFFISGNHIRGNEEVIKNISSYGNEIAINGYSNKPFTDLGVDDAIAEIEGTYDMLDSIDVKPSKIIRPPHGRLNSTIKNHISSPFVLWNIDATRYDKEIFRYEFIDNIEPGSIIKMDDSLIEELEEVIPLLQNRGYKFVTVDAMFKKYSSPLQPGKVYAKIKNHIN